jgi:hypothetical protein
VAAVLWRLQTRHPPDPFVSLSRSRVIVEHPLAVRSWRHLQKARLIAIIRAVRWPNAVRDRAKVKRAHIAVRDLLSIP